MTDHAFTLIELLVVICVLLVLAALLAPAIRSALDASRAAVCMSNLKQVGSAVVQYALAHGNYLVPHDDREWKTVLVGRDDLIAQGKLRPFISRDTFRCPADEGHICHPRLPRWWSYSFSTHNYRGDATGKTWHVAPDYFKLTACRAQAVVFLSGDEYDGGVEGNGDWPHQTPGLAPYRRHARAFHVLRLDGSVEHLAVTTDQDFQWTTIPKGARP